MKRPTVRLTLVMEWVAATAAGFGAARAFDGGGYGWDLWRVIVAWIGFLTGFAVVEGLIVAVEAVRRRRSPRPWGIGRWTWLMTIVYFDTPR
jgi:hypothetical protein